VDVPVFVFSLAVSSLAGLLFGVIPALTSARMDVREALAGTGRTTTAGRQLIRAVLVSSEVALAVLLLIVVTLLAKSFANVQAVAPGFDSTKVLSARLTLPAKRFSTPEAIVRFERELALRLSPLPTVTHMGAISVLPLSGLLARVPFTVEGTFIERERVPTAQYRLVSAGYFDAARIPVTRGRTFSERDAERAPAAAIVNEALARRWLDGLEPIGARLLVDDNDTGPRPIEIVGVVGDVRHMALDGEPTWDLYLPYSQIHFDNVGLAAANMFVILRASDNNPMNLASTLAEEVGRIDPEVAASQIKPLDHYLSDVMAPRRFSLSLMTAFGLAALALAVTGIYAVVIYSVSQRSREIAIRLALGARRSHIMRLVAGQSIQSVAIGLVSGVVLALAITRLLTSMLFGLTATDAMTFMQVALVMAAVSILTCAAPAVSVAVDSSILVGRLRSQ
jgi:putative ABC transport system permease protein